MFTYIHTFMYPVIVAIYHSLSLSENLGIIDIVSVCWCLGEREVNK